MAHIAGPPWCVITNSFSPLQPPLSPQISVSWCYADGRSDLPDHVLCGSLNLIALAAHWRVTGGAVMAPSMRQRVCGISSLLRLVTGYLRSILVRPASSMALKKVGWSPHYASPNPPVLPVSTSLQQPPSSTRQSAPSPVAGASPHSMRPWPARRGVCDRGVLGTGS